MLGAVIDNNVVIEVRDFFDEEVVDLMQKHQLVFDTTNFLQQPKVGWVFDGKTLLPPYAGAVTSLPIITRLAFKNRFTIGEKINIYTIANNPQGIVVQIYLQDLIVAQYVDLSAQNTIDAVTELAAIGCITQDRANEILNTPATLDEIYRG